MFRLTGKIKKEEFRRRLLDNRLRILAIDGRKRFTGYLWGVRRIPDGKRVKGPGVHVYDWEPYYEETIKELRDKYDETQVRVVLDLFIQTMKDWRETQITPVFFIPGIGSLYIGIPDLLIYKVVLPKYYWRTIKKVKEIGSRGYLHKYKLLRKAFLQNLRLFNLSVTGLLLKSKPLYVMKTWYSGMKDCTVDDDFPKYNEDIGFLENRKRFTKSFQDKMFIGLNITEYEKAKILNHGYAKNGSKKERKKYTKRTPERVFS